MIPYALMMLKIEWRRENGPDERKRRLLEVRALDAVYHGITFRISRNHEPMFAERPETIIASFLDSDTKTWNHIALKEFRLEKRQEGEDRDSSGIEPYRTEYELTSESPLFLQALEKLLKQYTSFVRIRLENDELTAMEQLSGITLSGRYTEEAPQFKPGSAGFLGSGGWEIGISLDTLRLQKLFLSMSWPDFQKLYWEENGFSGTGESAENAVKQLSVTHIYIGNQFCPMLLPEPALLEKLLDRTKQLQLKPVVVFSSMPENQISRFREVLNTLAGRAERASSGAAEPFPEPELIINDIGTAAMLKEYPGSRFRLTAGILLNKRKKDVRIKYLNNAEAITEANRESTSESVLYREYLRKRFGIERFSFETCGYPAGTEQSRKEAVLHLPMFQMNTSGWCTLYALCRNGNRGAQEEVTDCPHYCETHEVRYPEGLHMKGCWNSLFGEDEKALTDRSYLEQWLNNGVRRIVIRC